MYYAHHQKPRRIRNAINVFILNPSHEKPLIFYLHRDLQKLMVGLMIVFARMIPSSSCRFKCGSSRLYSIKIGLSRSMNPEATRTN